MALRSCPSGLSRWKNDLMRSLHGGIDDWIDILKMFACSKFWNNAAMVGGLAFHYLKHNRIDSLDMPANARLDHNLGTLPFAPKAI